MERVLSFTERRPRVLNSQLQGQASFTPAHAPSVFPLEDEQLEVRVVKQMLTDFYKPSTPLTPLVVSSPPPRPRSVSLATPAVSSSATSTTKQRIQPKTTEDIAGPSTTTLPKSSSTKKKPAKPKTESRVAPEAETTNLAVNEENKHDLISWTTPVVTPDSVPPLVSIKRRTSSASKNSTTRPKRRPASSLLSTSTVVADLSALNIIDEEQPASPPPVEPKRVKQAKRKEAVMTEKEPGGSLIGEPSTSLSRTTSTIKKSSKASSSITKEERTTKKRSQSISTTSAPILIPVPVPLGSQRTAEPLSSSLPVLLPSQAPLPSLPPSSFSANVPATVASLPSSSPSSYNQTHNGHKAPLPSYHEVARSKQAAAAAAAMAGLSNTNPQRIFVTDLPDDDTASRGRSRTLPHDHSVYHSTSSFDRTMASLDDIVLHQPRLHVHRSPSPQTPLSPSPQVTPTSGSSWMRSRSPSPSAQISYIPNLSVQDKVNQMIQVAQTCAFQPLSRARRRICYLEDFTFQSQLIVSEKNLVGSGFRFVEPLVPSQGCVSFESLTHVNYYLCHDNTKLMLQPFEDTAQFRSNATFFVQRGLSGFVNTFSFSALNSRLFLRHNETALVMEAGEGEQFQVDASFFLPVPSYTSLFPLLAPINPPPGINQAWCLQAICRPQRLLRHQLNACHLCTVTKEDELQSCTFVMVYGLAGSDTISFEAVSRPEYHLRHKNFRLQLEKKQKNDLAYSLDASFRIVPGMAAIPDTFSFQSFSHPDRFICVGTDEEESDASPSSSSSIASMLPLYVNPSANEQFLTNASFCLTNPQLIISVLSSRQPEMCMVM